MSLEYLSVPNGLRELLRGLAKEVLREKPPNLYEFSALYFESVLQKKQIGHARHEKTTTYENAFQSPTSIALLFQIIPEGLTNLIKDFVKAVLRKQPENICEFAVQYFRGQVENNSHKEMFSHSSILHTTYENYLKMRESYITYSPCTCGRPRMLEDAESLSDSIAGKTSSEIKLDQTNLTNEMLKSTKNHTPKNFKMTQEVASVIIQRRLRKLFAEKTSKSRKTSLITNTSIKDNISEVASYTSDSTVEMSAESVGEAKEKEAIEIGITTSRYQTITDVIKQSSAPQEELKTPTENCMSPEVGCVHKNQEVYHHDESFRTIRGIPKAEQSESDSGKCNTVDLGSITENESGNVEKCDNSIISNSVILKQSTENFQTRQANINENIYPNRNGNNSENLNQYKNVDGSESQRLNEVAKYMASDEGDKTNKDEFKSAEQNYIKEANLESKNHGENELVMVIKALEAKESSLLIETKEEHRENTSIQLYKSIQENEEITKKSVQEDSIQDLDIETLIETCGPEPMEILEENKAEKRKSNEIDGTSIETKISSGTSNEDLSKPKSLEEKLTDKKIDVSVSETDLSAIVKNEEEHECSTVAGIHSSNHIECNQYGPGNVRMENIPANLSTTKKVERHISENSIDKLQDIVHENTKSLEITKFIEEFQEESLPINYEFKYDGHDTFSEFGGKTERITNGNRNSGKISQTQSDETKTLKETAKSEKILYEKNDVLNMNNDDEKIPLKLDFYKDEALESSAYNDIDDQLKSHPLPLEIIQGDEIHAESLLNETRSNDIVKSETHTKICEELNVNHVFDDKEDDSENPTKSNSNENSGYQFPETDDFRKSETQDTEKDKAVNNISYDNRLNVLKQECQIELDITNENIINVVKNHPENKDQIKQKTLNNETSVEHNKTDHSIEAEVQNEFIKGEVCNTQILPETISDKENFTDKNRELKENFNIEGTPKNINNKTEDGITLKDSERQSPNFLYSLDEFVSEASARSTTKCMGIIEAEDSSSTGGCKTDANKTNADNVQERNEQEFCVMLKNPRENTESNDGNMTNQIETAIVVIETDTLVQDTVSPNSNNEAVRDQDLNNCKAVELLVTNDINPQLVTEEIAHQERTEIPSLNECYNSMMSENHDNRKENSRNLNPIESANLNSLIIPAMPVEILNTIIELNEPSAYRENESKLTEDLLTQTDKNTIEMRKQNANNAVNDATDRIQFGSGSDNDSECTSSSTCSKETDENVFSDSFVNESTDKTLHYPIRRSSFINSCKPNQGGIYEINPSSEVSLNSKLDLAISDEDNLVDDKETNTSCPALYYKDPNSQIPETAFDDIENHNDGDPNLLLEQYINQVTFANTYDQLDGIHKTELSSREGFSDNSKINELTENPYSRNMVHAQSRTEESLNSTNETLTAFTAETTKITEIQKTKSPILIPTTELSVNQTNLNDTDDDPKSKRTTSPKLDTIASQSFTKSCDKVRNAAAKIIQNAYRTFRTNQTKTTIDEEFKADISIESAVPSEVGMGNNQSNAASFLSINTISPSEVASPTNSCLEHLSETSSSNSNSKYPGEMFSASKSDRDQVISQESSSLEKDGERGDVRHHADNDDNVELKTEEKMIECIDSQIDTNKTNTALHDFQDEHDVMELDSRIEYEINKPPSTRVNSNKNTTDETFISNQCHAVGKMYVERDNGIIESRRVCTSEEDQLNLGSMSLEDFKSSIPYRKLEESLTKKTLTSIEIDKDSSCEGNEETSVSSSEVQYRLGDYDRDKREEYSLEQKTATLQKAEEIIKKMQQRRASETRVGSIDDRFSQEARFGEPNLISMKELEKNETFEMEDDSVVVLKSLESQCKDSREGSAQSQEVVFGIESKTPYDDKYNDGRIDLSNPSATKDSLQRLCKIPSNESKESSKSVTIDDSIKYIEPLENETTTITSSSCNTGNNATDEFNKMVKNCSQSEIDSGAAAKTSLKSTEKSKNDFHIITTDTEPTIKSAVIKIQAVARGFLIRKRFRQSRKKDNNKGSFRNATIVESSLGKFFEEDGAKEIHAASGKLYRERGIKSLCTNNDHDKKNTCLHSYATFDGEKIYEHEFSSSESGLAARRPTLQRGDAVRNDSTPDEENFGSDSASTPNPFQVETLIGKEKIAASCRNTEPTSSAADNNKKINNKLKWFMLRQNSMPVQIESEVFRVMPKHMRKRIKSAGCQKQKLRVFKN